RRRHTRFSRDWSSDVCSSDLVYNSDVADSVLIRNLYLEKYPSVITYDIGQSGCELTEGTITRQQYLDCIRNPLLEFINGENGGQIGRASCRERVEISEGGRQR